MLATLTPPTVPFDNAVTLREGWGVFEAGRHPDGTSQVQLQRIGIFGIPTFANDYDAWDHVVAQARRGSPLHCAALAAVDDVERMLIEAACGTW